jgi:hypothetical protein
MSRSTNEDDRDSLCPIQRAIDKRRNGWVTIVRDDLDLLPARLEPQRGTLRGADRERVSAPDGKYRWSSRPTD